MPNPQRCFDHQSRRHRRHVADLASGRRTRPAIRWISQDDAWQLWSAGSRGCGRASSISRCSRNWPSVPGRTPARARCPSGTSRPRRAAACPTADISRARQSGPAERGDFQGAARVRQRLCRSASGPRRRDPGAGRYRAPSSARSPICTRIGRVGPWNSWTPRSGWPGSSRCAIKHALACRRPIEYSPQVQPMILTPSHGSLPSGHSTKSFTDGHGALVAAPCCRHAKPPTRTDNWGSH